MRAGLLALLSPCHSFNFASLCLSSIVIDAHVSQRFAIRQSFNSDREKKMNPIHSTMFIYAYTSKFGFEKHNRKQEQRKKTHLNFITSSKWNYWDEISCQNDEEKKKTK